MQGLVGFAEWERSEVMKIARVGWGDGGGHKTVTMRSSALGGGVVSV